MSRAFPTRGELKCAGISFIISQICFIITITLFSVDYDIYNVQQESDVITLHNTLSHPQHRANIELSVAFVFISFPFLLISLHGLNKLAHSIFHNTPGEMIVYLLETSYTIWISVSTIIIPALSLVAVSFEWSWWIPQQNNRDFVATGYYIQAYALLYQLEMVDCTAIADATFMIALFVTPLIIHYGAKQGSDKLKRIKAVIAPANTCLFGAVIILLITIFIIIFAVVLFQFMRSGFQSPTGYAKYLLLSSFVCKILIGLRLFILGVSDSYDRINAVVEWCYMNQSQIERKPAAEPHMVDMDQEKETMIIYDDDIDESDIDPDEEGEDDGFFIAPIDISNVELKAKHIMPELETVTPMAKGPNIRL